MTRLRALWAGLAQRDRRILVLGALVLGLVLIWALVWEPLGAARDAARLRVAASSNDLATVRAVAPRLRDLIARDGGQPGQRDGRSLLALADASARGAGVGEALLRIEPVSGGQVRVYFEAASFDALVQWLDELETRQGVTSTELNVNRAAGVGRVDARVLLQRDGG